MHRKLLITFTSFNFIFSPVLSRSLWPQEEVQLPFISGNSQSSADLIFEHTKVSTPDEHEYSQPGYTSYEGLQNPYRLRVNAEPGTLCDTSVKQQTGYLDAGANKHLFFWFFESRHSPKTAPLILWMNGGPGCSSTTGLLFELGPCSILKDGEGTTRNNYSWNEFANIIFLDQPVNTGFSYTSDGSTPDNNADAAVDVWAFLQLFMKMFPEYAKLSFHLAAESYGGHFVPNIASVIHKKNQEIALAPIPAIVHINLDSMMIGNGLTDPLTQMGSVPRYACEGPYPMFESQSPECQSLKRKTRICQRLLRACYDFESRLTCAPAYLYCVNELQSDTISALNINPYDVRLPCKLENSTTDCYEEMAWIDIYLNKPEVQQVLGIAPGVHFQSCNFTVTELFLLQGDHSHNSAKLLPDLLNTGIRLLVYAGQADFACNFIGEEEWMEKLDGHSFHGEFKLASPSPWITLNSGKNAGYVRSAGPGAGNYTYVSVFEAGHMVPFNQPEASLDLITRWISNVPLSFKAGFW